MKLIAVQSKKSTGVGSRLRELAPAARGGSQEAGFTQPRAHLSADPCMFPEKHILLVEHLSRPKQEITY